MNTMTLEQAKALLEVCVRNELRDHAFGDREIDWQDPRLLALGQNAVIATGYFGSRGGEVEIHAEGGRKTWYGNDADELVGCGILGRISRNDETGPDEYKDGACMPGLTIEGVRKELTGGS
jgi:hypothetical protein